MIRGISDKKDELEQKIKDLETKNEELTNNWKRALADYQNLTKRIAEEKQELGVFVAKDLLKKILEILDLLEEAQKHLKDPGLDLIIKKFQTFLEQEKVVRIETKDKVFDPRTMECVEVREGNEEEKIAEEVSAGYKLDEQVLRVAKVKVFKKQIKGDYM